MPGKQSDSDADWTALTLCEQGGFAAVRRGCTLRRTELPGPARAQADSLLAQLQGLPQAAVDGLPDAQQLVVDVTVGHHTRTRVFDRADLPAEAAALLRLVRGLRPFGPL